MIALSVLELQMSLAELGLSPRAVLIVTVQSDNERTASFLQVLQCNQTITSL